MRHYLTTAFLRPKSLGFVELLRLYSAMLLLLPFASVGLFLLVEWTAGGLDVFKGRLELLLLVSVALPVLVSAPIGHSLARTLSTHLRLLAQSAQRVQEGDYGHTIDEDLYRNSPTELLQVAQAFNSMSQTVRSHVETIEATSRTDLLTGMCNRRHLLAEGFRVLNIAIRAGSACSCLMLDIDHFKNVNDTYGHPIGDRVLIHVAGVIAANIRESDLGARFGGEEFVVLAPNSGLNESVILAERIRTAIANSSVMVGNERIVVTVSIGVAEYDMDPSFGANVLEDMIEKADKALYRAKGNGRNRVEAWPFPTAPEHTP